jgi:ligand-binding sensor domain-containing protein
MMSYKRMSSLIFLSVAVLCITSRTSTATESTHVHRAIAVDTIPKSGSAGGKSDFDPYFIETTAAKSTTGPGSITRNIMQDGKGDYWLATWEGIIRYDGTTFTNHTNKDSLRRYHAFAGIEDRKGDLWFATIGAGVYRYDGDVFTNISTQDGLAYDRVGCLYEDRSGRIWIGTERGISVYNGSSRADGSLALQNYTIADGMPDHDVNSIVEDREGNYWIGTRGEACIYNSGRFISFARNDGSLFYNVRCIIQDQKGHVWLGGNGGLWRFDGSEYRRFASEFTGHIYEDGAGNIWTGSVGTDIHNWVLSRYDRVSLDSGRIQSTRIHAQQGQIFGIMEDRDGMIWFGTERGISRYDGMFVQQL